MGAMQFFEITNYWRERRNAMKARRFLVLILIVVILTNAIYLFFEYRKMKSETEYWKLRSGYLIELIEQEKKGE